jgi:hypothetical protein
VKEAALSSSMWQWGLIAVLYSTFLLVGTLFYTYYEGYGWSKGHFYAVNVGLNIGWGWTEEESDGSKAFSIIYLLVGFTLLALFVVIIGEQTYSGEQRRKALVRHLEYVELKREVEAGLVQPESLGQHLLRFFRQHTIPLHLFVAWLLYVAVGVIWSTLVVEEFSVLDGFYFILSSLSAGGMYSLPDDSPEYLYGITGIFTAIGIPLMALTFGLLVFSLILPFSHDDLLRALVKAVSQEEHKLAKVLLWGSDKTALSTSEDGQLLAPSSPSQQQQTLAQDHQGGTLSASELLTVLALRSGLSDDPQLLVYLFKAHMVPTTLQPQHH